MNPQERHLRPGRWVWAASMSVVVYSAFMLIPYGYAGFSGTGLFFAYIASLPVAACVLFTVGVWGGVGLLRSRVRERPLKPRHRAYVLVSCIGLASFALALGVLRTLPRPLPTGSHLQNFDRAIWQDPRSARYVAGGITLRQKMVADVVKNILPGRTRAELEEILGSSLDTSYFKTTGRDLIYVLGPQRDSYFMIGSEWLLIWLDKEGRFERYAIAND